MNAIGRPVSKSKAADLLTSQGFTVHTAPLHECGFPDSKFNAVFIWSCFEQVENPQSILQECRRILQPGGLLVLRAPNAVFYLLCRQLLLRRDLPGHARELLLEAMGYNNLLGFPYLYGHNQSTLDRLTRRFGFSLTAALNSELLTFPLPEDPAWVQDQERSVSNQIELLANQVLADARDPLTGPWIEVWLRAS